MSASGKLSSPLSSKVVFDHVQYATKEQVKVQVKRSSVVPATHPLILKHLAAHFSAITKFAFHLINCCIKGRGHCSVSLHTGNVRQFKRSRMLNLILQCTQHTINSKHNLTGHLYTRAEQVQAFLNQLDIEPLRRMTVATF